MYWVLFLFMLIAGAQGKATSCTADGWIAEGVQVGLTPANPQKGDDYTLTLNFTLRQEVSDGSITTDAYFNGFPIAHDVDNLCVILKDGTTPCPLQANTPIYAVARGQIPADVPSGTLEVRNTWALDSGAKILCYDVKANV